MGKVILHLSICVFGGLAVGWLLGACGYTTGDKEVWFVAIPFAVILNCFLWYFLDKED